MLLCLDVGNTHILGGLFKKTSPKDYSDTPLARFRYATHLIGTADQFGIFLLNMLHTHGINPTDITATAICSVVPSCDYTLRHTFSLYFKSHYFVLQSDCKMGLNIKYTNPHEVGADRIANAIGAIHAFPDKNIIVIDMGTATTVCAVTKAAEYLGGAILPGIRLNMESLKTHTAKLMAVDIEASATYIGQTTRESIQSGLYYGQLGALKELIAGFKQEVFSSEPVMIIGTGGFSQLYKDKLLFDIILPDLVLQGLRQAYTYATW